ncbi:MAG: hypothetical protein BWY59_00021 [Verrucomicrobia bacterium ADurb.Bin345]|nr:MAG: hypothetical protein BWY59_00021 [Verrucomicrobia bacterium ADurb.Bin345]
MFADPVDDAHFLPVHIGDADRAVAVVQHIAFHLAPGGIGDVHRIEQRVIGEADGHSLGDTPTLQIAGHLSDFLGSVVVFQRNDTACLVNVCDQSSHCVVGIENSAVVRIGNGFDSPGVVAIILCGPRPRFAGQFDAGYVSQPVRFQRYRRAFFRDDLRGITRCVIRIGNRVPVGIGHGQQHAVGVVAQHGIV